MDRTYRIVTVTGRDLPTEVEELHNEALLDPKPYKAKIVWGAKNLPHLMVNKGKPKLYEFTTETELDAFIKGVSEANGYLGYQIRTHKDEDFAEWDGEG